MKDLRGDLALGIQLQKGVEGPWRMSVLGACGRCWRLGAALLLGLSRGLVAQAAGVEHEVPLPAVVVQALRAAQVPTQALVVYVVPAERADAGVLVAHGAQRPVNPASVMKLVTTFAGLDLLGPEFVWRNAFLADGAWGDGVLKGNLYIRGSGDPKWVHERLQQDLQRVRALGIREIQGDIVLDDGVFVLTPRDPGEFDGESLRPYNVQADGLLLNFKSLTLTLLPHPAVGYAEVKVEPTLHGVSVESRVPLVRGPCDDWRSKLRADFNQPSAIRFAGSFSRNCGEKTWSIAYRDPVRYAERLVQAQIRSADVQLRGQVKYGRTPPSARLVLESESLPLAELIRDINLWSNNVMAQQLFLSLGRLPAAYANQRGDTLLELAPTAINALLAPSVTEEQAAQRLRAWWSARLPEQQSPVFDNGSGLSRDGRISAKALGQMLRLAYAHPRAPHFVDALAVAGVSGTVSHLTHAGVDAAHGRARLKTGTLNDVTALAGFVEGAQGRLWTMVAIVNHPEASKAKPALKALLNWVAQQP